MSEPNDREIRKLAKKQNLKATKSRKGGRLYLVFEFLNALKSWDRRIDNEEALKWLNSGDSKD